MLILCVAGIIGFAIGRGISLVVSQLFRQRFSLDIPNAKTLIVLGSGGHTTEMLEIVKKLDNEKYSPRYYVVAENDTNSVEKLAAVESKKDKDSRTINVFHITRSRKVHQSFVSSITTTLQAIFESFLVMIRIRPDLVLCNGPATCVPICLVAFLLKVFYIKSQCKIVFIESYCRVKTLSLSGWLLLYISDIFVVQWPNISKISRKILYFGRLT